MAVKPIPDGYHTITPYLYVRGAAAAIEFWTKAFGAVEVTRMPGPDGKVMHAEMKIGDSFIMLADEMPEHGYKSPLTLGGTTAAYALYVPDVDAVFAQAVAAGAIVMRPLADQFYGDRSGGVADPFGHHWVISTHKEDLTPAQMKERAEGCMKNPKKD